MATDDDLATLRARVAELEGAIGAFAAAFRRRFAKPSTDGIRQSAPLRRELGELLVAKNGATPTPDPRDARIAEVEQAAIQWRLRMAELETEAQESDARIAVLEAALRDIERRGEAFRSAKKAIIADCVMDLDWCRQRARRALGEETN